MLVHARGPEDNRRTRIEMIRKSIALVAGTVVAGVFAPYALGQVGETWRANQDFDTAADTATVVETLIDFDTDVGVYAVGTVTDDTSGRTKIVIYEYRDNGGSVMLEETATIPDSTDPSAWLGWDFTAVDAHIAGLGGFAVCGNVVDPVTGAMDAVAVCYKIVDLDDPLDRVWTTLLDPDEANQATALDSGGVGVAVTGWIDSGANPIGRDYFTYLLSSGTGSPLSGWPVQTDRSSFDEAVDVAVFDRPTCESGGGGSSLIPTPGPLTENRIVVTGDTNPSATKADITTVGYSDSGVQKWTQTFMGAFGSQQAFDTAAAIVGARWEGECPGAEYWGAYISGTSATASDSIPPASDIMTFAWGAMDGHPIWASSGGEPAGVRRFDSQNGADDRAFDNAVATPHDFGQHDPIGLWVAGQTPNPNSTTHVDFLVHRYDLATGAVPASWPSGGESTEGGAGEDDVALAISVHAHSVEDPGDARSRITGYGQGGMSTSIDFMSMSLDGGGQPTDSGYPVFLDESGQGTDVAVSTAHHPQSASEDDFFVLGTTTRSGSLPLDVTTVKYRDNSP